MSADSKTVDPGAVGAIEVADQDALGRGLDPAVIPTDRPVRQAHRVVRSAAERDRLFAEVNGARRHPVAADERKPSRIGAAPANQLGAALRERNRFGLETRHCVACPHRKVLPNRHDRTRTEAGSLVQVVDKNGAPVRLKKLRPWGHRGGMDYDIAVRVRAELER